MAVSKIITLMKPAPFREQIQNQTEIDKAYKYWRFRIFYSVYIGYVFFYFSRKSYTFLMPQMMEDLGYSHSKVGIIGTVLYLSYGISKFLSGIMSDKSNPRYFMTVGLVLTGILNIMFGFCTEVYLFALIWALNGIFQGWGWPPITKQLTHWYDKSERGKWWSLCSTSHNVGGGLIPYVVALCAVPVFGFSDWRTAMIITGIICVLVGFALMDRLRDIPQTLGLPPIEDYKSEQEKDYLESESKTLSTYEILVENVLSNKMVWIMAISYFFVYVVRTAVNDWTVTFMHSLGYSNIQGAVIIMWFELGGLLGMLFAGWVSDTVFNGFRIPFMIICALGMSIGLYLLSFFPNSSTSYGMLYGSVCSFTTGAFVFGPQMLIGLAAAEYVNKKAACTANGFVGCFAYAGAAATGLLGVIIDYSWDNYYNILILCSLLTALILAISIFVPRVLKTIEYLLNRLWRLFANLLGAV